MVRSLAKRNRWGVAAAILAATLCGANRSSQAQLQVGRPPNAAAPPPTIQLKSPASGCVFQRNGNGTADIALELPDELDGAKIVYATLNGPSNVTFGDGKFSGVPIGGPYEIWGIAELKNGEKRNYRVSQVFVGDLWVLAGQSNMQGVGNLTDLTPPNNRVMSLGMDGTWSIAKEPLHWLVDSPDPIHSGDPATRAARSAAEHKTRTKGAGLGLPFATILDSAEGSR